MRVDSLEFSYDSTRFTAYKFDELAFYRQTNSVFQLPCECVKCPSHECRKEACDSYDRCTYGKQHEGLKGVDVVLYDRYQLQLIELKDYRRNPTPPIDHIVAEVAKKFRDTLFLLWCGSLYAKNEQERNLMDACRRRQLSLSLVFHYESPLPSYASGFFSDRRRVVPQSTMRRRLEQVFGQICGENTIDVTNMNYLRDHPENFQWQVTEAETGQNNA